MIITCPECASEFDVPMAMIGPEGRKVRCANCRHEWHTEGSKPVPPVENPYKPLETKVSSTGFEIEFDIFKNAQDPSTSKLKGIKQKKTGKKSINIGDIKPLFAAFVVLCMLCGVFLSLQGILGAISPDIRRIYSGFGMDVALAAAPAENLGIDRLAIKQVWTEKGNTLEVATKIINLTETPQSVPAIQIDVVDQMGKATGERWRFDAPVKELGAEESVPLNAKLPSMPQKTGEVINLKVSFVP